MSLIKSMPLLLLMSIGLSANDFYTTLDDYNKERKIDLTKTDGCYLKPYEMNNKLIVGSQQDDARVIYSTGVILKVWVAPYYQGETLTSSHSNYVVVEAPKFLVGESVMKEGRKMDGLRSSDGQIPLAFRDDEIDRQTVKQQYSNSSIKSYVNNYNKSQNFADIPADNRIKESTAKYDNTIKDYLKSGK